jgi:type IV pilus biogenesis protein CpaD/CtpE
MLQKSVIVLATLFSLAACSNEEENDIVNAVPNDGAIETEVSVAHLNDSLDVLLTKHKVNISATKSKLIEVRDTIPALGNTVVQDEEGNDKTVKKAYDVFITIK